MDNVIHFDSGLYGFEDFTEYILLNDTEIDEFMYLQAVENKDICFVVINSTMIFPDYNPTIDKTQLDAIDIDTVEDLCLVNIVCVNEPLENSIVNLKSPIIINAKKQKGVQIILDGSYEIRRPLFVQNGGV